MTTTDTILELSSFPDDQHQICSKLRLSDDKLWSAYDIVSYFEISTQIKHFQHFVCDPLMQFVRLRSCGWKSAAPKSILTRKRLLKSALICWYTKVFGFKTSTPLQPFVFRLDDPLIPFFGCEKIDRHKSYCHTSLNRGTFFLYSIMH